MVTNLILLPSLLLSFDAGRKSATETPPLIEQVDPFYEEEENEAKEADIDIKPGLSQNN